MRFVNTKPATRQEFWAEHLKIGSIYFIRDARHNAVKIGYSRDPWARLIALQVGNPTRLALIGVAAADCRIEPGIHSDLREYHTNGEWFHFEGDVVELLDAWTFGDPMCRSIWRLHAAIPERREDGNWTRIYWRKGEMLPVPEAA